MNLLFDQNISFRILQPIEPFFPGAEHVREMGLENSTDLQIWEYAKQHHLAIVTFDADFYDFSFLWGPPPKIIWLRTGNKSTKDITNLLISKADLITSFLSDPSMREVACLELA